MVEMFKRIFILSILYMQFALAHNKVGNGGGGLRISHEKIITFSAHDLGYTGDLNGAPYLTEISNCRDPIFVSMRADMVKMRAFLPSDFMISLTKNLCPDGLSRYLDISFVEQQNLAIRTKLQSLKWIYEKATKFPASEIEIFALTNPLIQKTYVYPSFYKLSFLERKLILFHELFWIHKYPEGVPRISKDKLMQSYRLMLELEAALMSYLIQPEVFYHQNNLSKRAQAFIIY